MTKPIIIVEGAQFGSEAKGCVAAHLCKEREIDFAVRTGSINAGHSAEYDGKVYATQLIPVGWVNPNTILVLGGGVYIENNILEREIKMINDATGEDVRDRLYIDKRAGIHTDKHKEDESALHARMGSTAKGCASAIKEKMDRNFDYKLFSQTDFSKNYKIVDTATMLNDAYDDGKSILLEGTQGHWLDLHYGTYPYVTSRQTIATAWAMEAGLSPSLDYEIVSVVRAYPIRVAGNSGPFDNEISWDELADHINNKRARFGMEPIVSLDSLAAYKHALRATADEMGLPSPYPHLWHPDQQVEFKEKLTELHKETLVSLSEGVQKELYKLFEVTTVTKKLRRIAEMSEPQLKESFLIDRPQYVVITFLEYMFPTLFGVGTWDEIKSSPEYDDIAKFIEEFEDKYGVKVGYVNTEPSGIIKVE